MEAIKRNHKRILPIKIAEIILTSFVFVFIFEISFFAIPTLANEEIEKDRIVQDHIFVEQVKEEKEYVQPDKNLPVNSDKKATNEIFRVITAYNSEAAQCDSTPCITANGFNVCEHNQEDTIAANFLKFGTKVKIPDYFGDRVFIVRDRMSQKFPNRVDIWMKSKTDAKKFGKKYARIVVIE